MIVNGIFDRRQTERAINRLKLKGWRDGAGADTGGSCGMRKKTGSDMLL